MMSIGTIDVHCHMLIVSYGDGGQIFSFTKRWYKYLRKQPYQELEPHLDSSCSCLRRLNDGIVSHRSGPYHAIVGVAHPT